MEVDGRSPDYPLGRIGKAYLKRLSVFSVFRPLPATHRTNQRREKSAFIRSTKTTRANSHAQILKVDSYTAMRSESAESIKGYGKVGKGQYRLCQYQQKARSDCAPLKQAHY